MKKKKEVNLLLWFVIILAAVAAVVLFLMFGGSNPLPNTEQPQTKPVQTEPLQTEPAQTDPTEEIGSKIYAMVPSDWETVNIWAWAYQGEDAFEAWPGEYMNKGRDGWYYATIPTWADCVIISGNDGTVQTYDLMVGAGVDAWIYVRTPEYTDIYYSQPSADDLTSDPFLDAALREDYDLMKELLPTIKDRSILTAWEYNDFNSVYAGEAVLAGDYETAIEFFGYCASEYDRAYATFFRKLLDKDMEGALDTLNSMEFTNLAWELDTTWPEIICNGLGIEKNESDPGYVLMENYLHRRLSTYQPEFTEDSLVFGEPSSWEAEHYIGQITNSTDYPPISDLNALYAQCGSDPKGKVLVLRSQTSYPRGATHYAIDLMVMEYLGYDLYPASFSEVEYIILVNYDYNDEGRYQQTFTAGDNSEVSYFNFLRMKGQVQLVNVLSRQTIQQSAWVQGTGQAEAHFSDLEYQCSNMPETGADIKNAVAKVRELNAAK